MGCTDGVKSGLKERVMKKLQKKKPITQEQQCAILNKENEQSRNDGPYGPDSIPRTFAQPFRPVELDGRRASTIPGHVIGRQDFVMEHYAPPAPRQLPEQLQIRRPLPDRSTAATEYKPKPDPAEEAMSRRKQNASAQNIRHLRHLIREKYRIDVEVWKRRGVQKAMRPAIVKKAQRSDAILQEMPGIFDAWDENLFSKEEWRSDLKTKTYIAQPDSDHLLWGDLPPWDEQRERVGRLSGESWEHDEEAA